MPGRPEAPAGAASSRRGLSASPQPLRQARRIRLARDGLELARLYSASYLKSIGRGEDFAGVEAFCLFVGSGRSGHSLIGSLLDAHPRMVVARELDILRFVESSFGKRQLFQLALDRSRLNARKRGQGKFNTYWIPDQWQGRYERLQVLGVKSAQASERRLRSNPDLLARLADAVGVPIKLIHPIRNPYDNITTLAARQNTELERAARQYFLRCATVASLAERSSGSEILHVRHETFLSNPVEGLRELCRFLGVEAPTDYLEDCAAIVNPEPRKARADAIWEPAEISSVAEEMRRYDFLDGYSFDS